MIKHLTLLILKCSEGNSICSFKKDIVAISVNYDFVVDIISMLESSQMRLQDSLALIDCVILRLATITCKKSDIIQSKLAAV